VDLNGDSLIEIMEIALMFDNRDMHILQ